MSERRHTMSAPPTVLVKVVHGAEVRMNGGAIRHGGEVFRIPATLAKVLVSERRVTLL